MDTFAIESTIIVVLIFAIIIILVKLTRKGKTNKQLNNLHKFAELNNSKISEYEMFEDRIFGVDKENNKLFFIRNDEERFLEKAIFLKDFDKCKIVKHHATVKNNGQSYDILDSLDIVFQPKDKVKAVDKINIYDSNFDNLTLSGEVQFAEKWSKKIEEFMK